MRLTVAALCTFQALRRLPPTSRQDAVAKTVADELAARNTALLEEFQQRLGPETLCAERADTGQETWVMAGRLPDVAARAALQTDADVHVLPPAEAMALDDGIGGLCRFGRSASTAQGV